MSDLYVCGIEHLFGKKQPVYVSVISRDSSAPSDYTSRGLWLSLGPSDERKSSYIMEMYYTDKSEDVLAVEVAPCSHPAMAACRSALIRHVLAELHWNSYSSLIWVSRDHHAARGLLGEWRAWLKKRELRIVGKMAPIRTREWTDDEPGNYEPVTWVYDCGWRLKGNSPTRETFFGHQEIAAVIGVQDFFKETGVLPQ